MMSQGTIITMLIIVVSVFKRIECGKYDRLDLDTLDKNHKITQAEIALAEKSDDQIAKDAAAGERNVINSIDAAAGERNVINSIDSDEGSFKRRLYEEEDDDVESDDIDRREMDSTQIRGNIPFNDPHKHIKGDGGKLAKSKYLPNWDSLDERPVPEWYEDAKFGIFVHWGVYSVPAFKSEWFWWHWQGEHKSDYQRYMHDNYPTYSYQDFAPLLTAKNLDTDKWAQLVEDSGAKYFLFTSKHHEGFTHWKSEESWNWNSVDIGPKRDIIDELKQSFEDTNVTFGLYFSLYEWFNPWYKRDKRNKFKTQEFVEKKIRHQLKDIVLRYEPKYIWSDGDWETDSDYWNSTNFLSWLYNESPVGEEVVVNDRWGTDANCVHGDVKTCKDRYNPGKKVPYKWENAMTIDKLSWGYRQEASLDSYISTHKLIETLIETVSCGGNIVMNIAPTADGRIIPIYEERLREIGKWLKINGDAIYGTRTWRVQKESSAWKTWYTKKGDKVYALMCRWPKERYLILKSPKVNAKTRVYLLGYRDEIVFTKERKGLKIDLHQIRSWELLNHNGWAFLLENVK